MKGLKTLVATALGLALLVAASSAMGKGAAPVPRKSAVYTHYVACGLSQNAKPSHICQKARKKGAFFRSNKADVFYSVCVKFPSTKNLCRPKQEAKKGQLYVNKITSTIPGKHRVTWFVEGQRVGAFVFRVPR
jgi:hypothetical protein